MASKGDLNFDSVIAAPRIGLNIVDIWPSPDETTTAEDWMALVKFTMSILIGICFINAPQTVQLGMAWGDFNRMTNIISIANLPIGISLLKMIVLRINKNALRNLVRKMRTDWEIPNSKQELDNMIRNAIMTRKLSVISISLGTSTGFGFVAIQLYQELSRPSGQPVECRIAALDAFFPYNQNITPNYQINWFLTCTAGVLAMLAYAAIDSFFFTLMFHLCAQLKNLRYRLQCITLEDNECVYAASFKGRIIDIVAKHETLYRFADTIEQAFNIMFLSQVMFSTIQICLQGYLFIDLLGTKRQSKLLDMSNFVIYAILVNSALLYMYCYAADKVREESILVIRAAYDSQWFGISPRDAKLLIPIMCRAQTPIEITAGKFVALSIELFAQVLKTSGGYLSMLLAVKDRIAKVDE